LSDVNSNAFAERYSQLSEQDLLMLALEPGSLVRDARHKLADELATRGLSPRLQSALRHNVEELPKAQLDALTAELQQRPCPLCGGVATSLNAGVGVIAVPSVTLIVGVLEKKTVFYVGCTPCMKSKGIRIKSPERDGRAPPTPEMTDFVYARAGLLLEFRGSSVVFDAVLSLDNRRLLEAISQLR
jgi:hypothetical protein